MRPARFAVIGCLLVAACGGTTGGETATTVPVSLGELSYGYEPGSTYNYEVTLTQSLALDGSVAGDLPAEDAPDPRQRRRHHDPGRDGDVRGGRG